jgi:4-hydroxy-tetrahydrodipicolinate synthase
LQLSGSITALVTPFDASGAIDFSAWQRLLEGQLEGGTNAVVVAGSTGEAAALSDEEYQSLISSTVRVVAGRIPVIAGTGLSNTAKTIAQTQLAKSAGAQIALVVTPPYVRPTQAGLIAHYTEVADNGGLPVILYNVPGRTGCDMQPETVAALSKHPNIIGVKEAKADGERIRSLAPLNSKDFAVLSGDDNTFLTAMEQGYQGVISVASNVVPRSFARICQWVKAKNFTPARELDNELQSLYDFTGVEPNPIPVKFLLAEMGIGSGLRLPLTTLSDAHHSLGKAFVQQIAAIEKN